MARKTSPTILQEELYPPPGEPERGLDDTRLVDLDVEEESPFLRGQKRVPARRGPLPKKTLHLLGWSAVALVFAWKLNPVNVKYLGPCASTAGRRVHRLRSACASLRSGMTGDFE